MHIQYNLASSKRSSKLKLYFQSIIFHLSAALECKLQSSLLLPAGSSQYESKIISCVGVTDAVGSTAFKFLRNIAVYQKQIKMEDLSSMLSSDGGALADLTKSGDASAVASFAMAMLSSLESVDSSPTGDTPAVDAQDDYPTEQTGDVVQGVPGVSDVQTDAPDANAIPATTPLPTMTTSTPRTTTISPEKQAEAQSITSFIIN